ncbi:hypothetical protein R6242_19430 [Iodobacter sp. CM08]|uniref:hypothetical protein n=1 Tax=Iodobacter sp. CM08 TaxID=3085902 RepID=UPI0029823798|nr:hypothetical protein [Iodobacter sp. CM08]MDW5418744.1 hypothetical protein [Iodobacter sp. CM08]
MSDLNSNKNASQLPLDTWLFLDNNLYGRLFAADSDKKDNDHMVETSANPDGSDKYQWKIYQRAGNYFLLNKKYGFLFAADTDKYDNDHVVECAPDKTDLAQVPESKKWQWQITPLQHGLGWLIGNGAYGQMFSANGDKKGDDHVVEASPSSPSLNQSAAKWVWQIVPVESSQPTIELMHLDTPQYGHLFAAASDKKGSDHLVETRQGDGEDIVGDKYDWRLYWLDGQLYIQNKAYGFLFAADSDKDGDNFILECDPDVITLKQAINKGSGNGKWRWFMFDDKLVNMKHGQVFATDKAVYGNDHGVRANPNRYTDLSSEPGYQWRSSPADPNQMFESGWMRLHNAEQNGDMFGADSDKKGSDHIVEVSPEKTGDSDKWYWKLYRYQGKDYLCNKKHGFLFAADGDKYNDDHVAECDPSVTDITVVLKKGMANSKWQWHVSRLNDRFQIQNLSYGTLFTASGDKFGNDHVVETNPNNKVIGTNKAAWQLFAFNDNKEINSLDRVLRPASNCDWMSTLPDATYLTDIALPGTHDSAAILRFGRSLYATQNLSLTEQLESGIRLFDIRLQVKSGNTPGSYEFNTCHGNIGSAINLNVYQTLQSALDESIQFLNEHGREALVMSLKIDDFKVPDKDRDEALKALKNFIDRYPRLWATPNKLTLGNARGRVLLLNRISNSTTFGAPVSWSDNTTGQTIQPPQSTATRDYQGYVQDQYQASSESEKWTHFETAISHKPDAGLLLNFASAIQMAVFGVYIQPNFLNYLGKLNQRPSRDKMGWSLWDYPNWSYPITGSDQLAYATVTDLIIDSNFGYSRYSSAFEVNMKEDL